MDNTSNTNNTITLLDTRSLLLRDYYGTEYKEIKTENGDFTKWEDGLASFVDRTISPILNSVSPRQVYACFDDGNTFRRKLYSEYKQTRRDRDSKIDAAVTEQMQLYKEKARQVLKYLGITCVHVPGEEADDLLALLATRTQADAVMIRTSDEDLLQLVNDKVSVIRLDKLYATGGFGLTENKGTHVSLIRLKKAIVGDSSDNYKGIKGAGEKFFEGLVGSLSQEWLVWLEQVIAANSREHLLIDQLKGNQFVEKIYNQFNEAYLGYELARLHPEACYGEYKNNPKYPVFERRVPNEEKVSAILKEAGINMPPNWKYLFPTEELITGDQHQKLVQLMGDVKKSPIVSYDFETADKKQIASFREVDKKFVDVINSELTGLSINYGSNLQHTFYVPFDHKDTANFPKEWAVWILKQLDSLGDRAVVQNANFEVAVSMKDLGYQVRAPYDTKIMASYVDENREAGLKSMSSEWLRFKQASYEETTQGRPMNQLTGAEVLSYGCDDSLVTSHLFDMFRTIMQLEGSWDFYCKNEVEPTIDDVKTYLRGTPIDLEKMAEFREEARKKVKLSTEELHNALAANCMKGAHHLDEMRLQQAATTLYQEWWMLAQYKDGSEENRQKIWEKAFFSCFYTPYSEKTIEKKIAATPKILSQAISRIAPGAPAVEKATAKYLEEEWDAMASDFCEESKSEEFKEFQEALWNARKNLSASKRSGEAYETLVGLIKKHLGKDDTTNVVKTGDELNMNSPVQMQSMIYGKMGLPLRRRSKVQDKSSRAEKGLEGSPATGLKAIAAAFVHDVTDPNDWRSEALMNYREVSLLQQEESLYYKKYPLLTYPDGRIHPQFINCGTSTRRPTGSMPNDLQVSKKNDAKIRKCYPAGEGRAYVSVDLSNQEILVVACESKDPVMLEAFGSNPRKDLHSVTATGFAHLLLPRSGFDITSPMSYEQFRYYIHSDKDEDKELKDACKEIRNKYAKACNFLIAYGGSFSTLAENLLIPKELAKELMDQTFALYQRLQPWQQEVCEKARRLGYVETPYGSRRHANKDLWSHEDGLRKRQERQLINFTIQGTAADLLKVVKQDIKDRDMVNRYQMEAVKYIYDEVSASVPLDRVVDYCNEIVEVMEIAPPGHPIAMQTEISIGPTWGDVKEVSLTGVPEMVASLKP